MTPDPAGIAAVDLTNPQSLNRYAYVLGNPFALVDPTGLGAITTSADCRANLSLCKSSNHSLWEYQQYLNSGAINVPPNEFGLMQASIAPTGYSWTGDGWEPIPGDLLSFTTPQSTSSQPQKNEPTIGPAPPKYTQILPCIKRHFALTAAGVGGAGIAATSSITVSKNVAGVSERLLGDPRGKTSLIRAVATRTGLDLDVGVRFLGTKSLAGILGRGAGAWLGSAVTVVDAYQVGSCVVNGDWSGLPQETGLPPSF